MKQYLIGASLLAGSLAHAGGMQLPIRGVHDTERAGALVAGTEDADSLWLNPAGLAHLLDGDDDATTPYGTKLASPTKQFVADAAYVNQSVDYARIDSGDNQLGAVSNVYPGITVPTLAMAAAIDHKIVVAGGLTAPYAGLHRYDADAARYTSISLAESTFVMLTGGVAIAPIPELRIGLQVTNMIAVLKSQVVLSGCPGQTICAPEDPEFDARTKVNVHDFIAPSATLGIQYDAGKKVTLAASATSPTWIDAKGTVQTRLPSAAYFEGAMVTGNDISVKFTLPPMTKFGVEVRPNAQLRIEAALDIEYWSMHKDMELTTSNVRIENGAGVGTYDLSPIVIPRHYKNSFAPSIGGEYRFGKAQIGAGYSYETAAAPKAYVSTLTVDSAKHIIGLGGSYAVGAWQLGGAFAFVKLTDVDVALADAKVPQLTPLRDQPSEIMVNAGHYKSNYIVGGVRMSRRF